MCSVVTMSNTINREIRMKAGRFFTPYTPIDARDLFAGRLEQLHIVIDAVVQKGLHAILFGERGVGKTSLSSVISHFLDVEPALCLRVNCGSSDTFESVWKKLFSEIEIVLDRPSPRFGDEIARNRIRAGDHFKEDRTPFGACRLLSRISVDSLPIVIIDEFDQLPSSAKGDFADLVKMLSDHAVPATIVLVGVADSVDELIAEHESTERALIQIRLPRMSQSEIGEIVDNGLSQLGLEILQEAKDRIVLLSQGLPHYAHLLALHSVRSAVMGDEPEIIQPRHVEHAISLGLEFAQQSILTAYHRATTSPRADNLFRQVLCACAVAKTDELGFFAAADVRQPMHWIMGQRYGIPAFARHLAEFRSEKRGCILQRIGSPRRYRFRFRNPLMQPFTIMKGLDSGMIKPEMLEAAPSASRQGQAPRP